MEKSINTHAQNCVRNQVISGRYKMPQNKTDYPNTKRAQTCLFDQIIAAGREGKSHAQMAELIGIDRKTLQSWLSEHNDFAAAMKQADDYALAWWEALGQKHAETREGNAAMIIFVMKNRFGKDYGDGEAISDIDAEPVNFSEMAPKVRKKIRKLLSGEIGADQRPAP